MRRRDNLVFVLVLVAFIGAIVWLLRRTDVAPEPEFASLTTYSPKPDGAQALYELTESVGLKPKRYGDSEYHYPPDACMVVLDIGGIESILGGGLDAKALRLWLERGGRMVLCTEPEDDYGIAHGLFKELQADEPTPQLLPELNTPSCEATPDGRGKSGKLTPSGRFDSYGDIYKLPATKFALFVGVTRIEHATATPTMVKAVQLLGSDAPVLWYRKVGKGELFWLTRPEMASNSWISRADNHRLLLNVIEAGVRGGRQLYFDEHIHGFARETPNLLAILTHTRGGHLLLTLIALGLLLFAGAAVRPAKYSADNVPERRVGVEMVLAQADLYERAGARHVIADSQVDSLRRAFMEQRHLAAPPSEQQMRDWVEQDWRGDAKRGAMLLEYLRSKLLPRSPHALLELARACDEAKSMLT